MNKELINKIFPSEEMRQDFQKYQGMSKAEREEFIARKKGEFENESDELRNKHIDEALEAGENAVHELQELIILKQLQNVSPFISLSEISKTYFGKSRGWLSQRLHENEIRGRRVCLKPDELDTLKRALLDISDKLKNTALSLSFS